MERTNSNSETHVCHWAIALFLSVLVSVGSVAHAANQCSELFSFDAVAENQLITSGLTKVEARNTLDATREWCHGKSSECTARLFTQFAEIKPTIIEIEIPISSRPDIFPQEKLTITKSFLGFFKSRIMWNPLWRKFVRAVVLNHNRTQFELPFSQILLNKLEIGMTYNFVLLDTKMVIAPTGHSNLVNDLLSKHILLADGQNVDFAGTVEHLPDGDWVISNASGSYRPTIESLENTRTYFETVLGLRNVQIKDHKLKTLTPTPGTIVGNLNEKLQQWLVLHQRVPREDSTDPDEVIAALTSSLVRATPITRPIRFQTAPLLERFVGENLGKTLFSKAKSKDVHFQTKYLNEQERETFKLTFKNTKVYDHNGELYDSSDGDLKGLSNSKGRVIFVMDKKGDFYASKEQESGKFHHSSFLAGAPIAFAGEMIVKNGIITYIKNFSGHYEPKPTLFAQLLVVLRAKEIKLSGIVLEGADK
jgi:hypothetical protein